MAKIKVASSYISVTGELFVVDTAGRLWSTTDGKNWNLLELPEEPGLQ